MIVILIIYIFILGCDQISIAAAVDNTASSSHSSSTTIMRQMWVTPIQTSNILSANNGINRTQNEKLLAGIKREIQNHFVNYATNRSLIDEIHRKWDLHDEATLSDSFYFYQLDIQKVAEYQQSHQRMKKLNRYYNSLQLIAKEYISTFLHECHLTPQAIARIVDNKDSDAFYMWASVHQHGSHHQAHHHVNSIVSGVFYISLPSIEQPTSSSSSSSSSTDSTKHAESSKINSNNRVGSIVFEDPRGNLPPFGKSFRYTPSVGDLVLFPGWLVHRVDPTTIAIATRNKDTDRVDMFDNLRISVSFNVAGNWNDISDVNNGYYVD